MTNHHRPTLLSGNGRSINEAAVILGAAPRSQSKDISRHDHHITRAATPRDAADRAFAVPAHSTLGAAQ